MTSRHATRVGGIARAKAVEIVETRNRMQYRQKADRECRTEQRSRRITQNAIAFLDDLSRLQQGFSFADKRAKKRLESQTCMRRRASIFLDDDALSR
jgi:hypothetical protein